MSNKSLNIRFINPSSLAKPFGYSHVVQVTGGTTFYISGQVPLDAEGNWWGEGDLRAQATQVFRNLKAALEAAGADFNSVVKLGFYLTDISQIAVVREVRDQYINTENPPASTAVQVSRLFRDGILIEVDAIAVKG
ncbi:MAG TPA: RidA family protein [Anaerolineales bacterium]|jgi:reactive intermediate/imine deaminase|nr:RidA family protein [Anaerolineales bacterium]